MAMDTVFVVVTADPTTGFEQLDLNDIALYPNPVNDMLVIEGILDQYTIEIYSNQGQLMLSRALNGPRNVLDMTSLDRGMYFLKIYSGDTLVKIEKVLKQ